MKLVINGKNKVINCEKISDLLDILNLEKDIVAVELNKNIIHRQDFDNTKLKDHDNLEIVTVVGGGYVKNFITDKFLGNSRFGCSETVVIEADESDGSFLP